jgi:hypothetical protein
MSQVCSKCAHANPAEAIYCYFDGIVLGGHSGNGSKVQAGARPFPSEFVFPSGQICRNFDQLAMACQQNWLSAVDLLKQGFLASFLSGIGRTDLALAAKEAARFPDTDRGLDRLLAKIPSHVLEAPKLRAEPTDVSLGVVPLGTDRSFELHLANLGMRLLYGSVSSDCKWLALGDVPGNPQKLFQFGGDAIVPVQIRGRHLRAGSKPLEGHLLIESNGGTNTITVRAEVPPKPYVNGVLAGAVTPRQVAEKALAAPKDAAPLFESGAVAKWFNANGWTYPVQGPSASGVGAVQQFFEALGLSKPPKVEINQMALTLRGDVGQGAQANLELKTQEKRPIYGHAVCDQPWLDVSRAVLSGRNAVIQVVVPRIPNRPGETLQATVTVTTNGNQKFRVPVSLEIGEPATYGVAGLAASAGGASAIPVVQAIPIPSAGPARGASHILTAEVVPVDAAVPAGPFVPLAFAPKRPAGSAKTSKPVPFAGHTLPAWLLGLLLLLVLARDIFFAPVLTDDSIPIEPRPLLAVHFDQEAPKAEQLGSAMRFGLVALPANNKQPERKLTYDKYGRTNSTVVRIGDQTRLFGIANGAESRWVTKAEELKSPFLRNADRGSLAGFKSVWQFQDQKNAAIKMQIIQLVELVPGEPIELKSGNRKRYFDTCQVRYLFENVGQEETKVGLRILIDTLIGVDASNDGVPFTVPGLPGLVDTSANFQAPKKIPDFLQVLEVPDLKNPGIIGFMNLKLGGGVEPPGRVLLTHWTDLLTMWDVPERPFQDEKGPPDSAVVLYWPEKPLGKGAKREVGFSYGLGTVSITGGRLGVSVGGSFVPNGDLTVVALVNNPTIGQKLTLQLPPGLEIVEGDAKQAVPPVPPGAGAQQSPVSWRIRAVREGTYVIEVQSSTGDVQKKRITIKTKTIF